MLISCWKPIGSPTLTESPNTLKEFHGRIFSPLGILKLLPIILKGKSIEVDVEINDSPLDLNILLGHSWIYTMSAVVSYLFKVIKFPCQGKIVTINQLEYFNVDSRVDNVPFVGKTPTNCENIGVGLFKDSLLGAFHIPPPQYFSTMACINMTSKIIPKGQSQLDSWVVPKPADYQKYGDAMSPNEIEVAYQSIQSISTITDGE